jgi:hypothetical protein
VVTTAPLCSINILIEKQGFGGPAIMDLLERDWILPMKEALFVRALF